MCMKFTKFEKKDECPSLFIPEIIVSEIGFDWNV